MTQIILIAQQGLLTFDKNLEIVPKTSNTSVLIMYIGFLLLVGIMIFLIIKVVKKGTQKAKKWLTLLSLI